MPGSAPSAHLESTPSRGCAGRGLLFCAVPGKVSFTEKALEWGGRAGYPVLPVTVRGQSARNPAVQLGSPLLPHTFTQVFGSSKRDVLVPPLANRHVLRLD